jgi:diguanylate cyclase (GGDEF)-like protein
MFVTGSQQPAVLDIATLSVVAICVAVLLGLFLLFTWLQQRQVRALGWWGWAYLIGASSLALWSAPTHIFTMPPEVPGALIFIACGMIWNGVRLFQGRRVLPLATFGGALIWLIGSQLPGFVAYSLARIALGAIVVATYTFCIAFEFWRDRRHSLRSRTGAVAVPALHASIFLMPFAMRIFLPEALARNWLTVFMLETIIYAIGTAFIVMLMVKDHYVHVYRSAANTDPLTGLLNRRGFTECARNLCAQYARHRPIALLMFDLDHFKSINDRFGHAVGDEVLRVFAQVTTAHLRASDMIGRLGGEEFAAILPADRDQAAMIAERIRAAFEVAGVAVDRHTIGATVSIGAALSNAPVTNIEALLLLADKALYQAKAAGRNRVEIAGEKPSCQAAHLIAAAREDTMPDNVVALPARKNAA